MDQKTQSLKPFPIAPAGTVRGVCVDFIDLGENAEAFGSNDPKLVEKVAYVFQIDEYDDQGKPFEVALELTASLGKKANMRKLLGNWRGADLTEAEINAGVAYHEYVIHPALVTIKHKESKATGKTYANIGNLTPLPKGMEPLVAQPYERRAFWTTRKEEYAAAAAAFRAQHDPNRTGPLKTVAVPATADLPF